MKKLLFLLCLVLFATSFSFAQTFPDSGKDFVVSGNWNAYQNTIKMAKSVNNLYTYQQSLTVLNGGSTPYAYQYTIPFQNPAWGGRINQLERQFTLAADQLVTFYAKAFTSDGGTTYWTKYICDAQPVIFIFPALSSPNNVKILPLPVNGKSSAVVNLPASTSLSYQVVVNDKKGGNVWEDLNDTGNENQPLYAVTGGGGRYKLMVDYTTISSTTAKVLDNIDSPQIKVGTSGTFVAPDASFAGTNLGTFNNSSALKIGASLKAYSLLQAVNVADVTATLYYQITKSGYDSGIQGLALATTGTTMTNATFTNATDLDVSTGLENGDFTLKVWYGATCFEDTLLIDNTGAGYSASFSVNNVATSFENPTIATKISTENGIINASFDKTVEVKLFTIAGQLVNQTVATKNYSQAVQQGVYILYVNGKSHKIIVK